jgi:hypothetical protein
MAALPKLVRRVNFIVYLVVWNLSSSVGPIANLVGRSKEFLDFARTLDRCQVEGSCEVTARPRKIQAPPLPPGRLPMRAKNLSSLLAFLRIRFAFCFLAAGTSYEAIYNFFVLFNGFDDPDSHPLDLR